MPLLSEIRIPRCFKPAKLAGIIQVELHHFYDASEYAYLAASYIKIYDIDGNIRTSLVMEKARVALIMPVTIPRLEHSTAVVAVRLHQQVYDVIEYAVNKVFFWTDFMSTIRYISNTTSRFKVFVANRLFIFHEVSDAKDWHYISTKENAADLASRGNSTHDRRSFPRWFNGPAFLQEPNDTKHTDRSTKLLTDKQENFEVKAIFATEALDDSKVNPTHLITQILQRCSSFHKVKLMICWLIRYSQFCIRRYLKDVDVPIGPLKIEEMNSEHSVLKHVQEEVYQREIKLLRNNNQAKLLRNSFIIKLSPLLNIDLLRVRGRLDHADVS